MVQGFHWLPLVPIMSSWCHWRTGACHSSCKRDDHNNKKGVWPQLGIWCKGEKYDHKNMKQCEQNSVSHNIKGYWSIFWVICRLSFTPAVKKGISTRLVGLIMTYSLPFLVEFQQSFCCGKKSLCHLFASHVLQYCYTFIIKHLRWKQKDFLGSLKAFEMLWCMRKIFYIF